MNNSNSIQRDKPLNEDEFHRRFNQAWPVGWNYGYYDKPLPCPFKDEDQKRFFLAGIEDGKKAAKMTGSSNESGEKKRPGRPKKILADSNAA
jgi:hypothetical protein